MSIICPNLKNEEVAREFEELKNATSEAAAYHIWSLNNGNSIDKAPNGEPSKLFSDLLEHYNGDRVAAIQAKARTYSESFRNWFGESKVVDENGEPLVVYHGTNSTISDFNYKDDREFNAGFFFTSDKNYAESVAEAKSGNIIMPVFLKITNPIYTETDLVSKVIESIYIYEGERNSDGIIGHDKYTGEFARSAGNEYLVTRPNQIKSIDNQGTFSTKDNNIYNQKVVSKETRLENFYNSYVKLRTKTVEKAENETELRKRRSKLSSNSKLRETNLDAIMQEILGIYIYDADYSTVDSTLRELNNLSESRYLTLLNEEIDKLDRLLIPVDSLIAAVNNINKGYNKLSDYSKEVQDRLFNMPVYREATELPVITQAKSLKQYNAYQKIKYNKELNTFISNLKLTQLKLAARKYHLDTIKMFVEEYDRGFEDMKLKVLDEYLYRTSLLSKKAPKLQGTYNLLEDLAKGQSELDTRNANEQMQKYLMLLTSNKH